MNTKYVAPLALAAFGVVAYLAMTGGDPAKLPAVQSPAAQTLDSPSKPFLDLPQESAKADQPRERATTDFAPGKLGYLDPKHTAPTPASFSSNPSLGRALLIKSCITHFAARASRDQDLADLHQAQQSGHPRYANLVEEANFTNSVLDVQCRDVTERDLAQIPELLRVAAQEGSTYAKAELVRERLDTLRNSKSWELMSDGTATAEQTAAIQKQVSSMRAEASELAKAGVFGAAGVMVDLQIATISTDAGYLKDTAFWLLVSAQEPGQKFQPNVSSLFQTEPYSNFSDKEKQEVKQRADEFFASCCSKPQRR